jgi:hypothetical protein
MEKYISITPVIKKVTLKNTHNVKYAAAGVMKTQIPATIKIIPNNKIRYQCLIVSLTVSANTFCIFHSLFIKLNENIVIIESIIISFLKPTIFLIYIFIYLHGACLTRVLYNFYNR